MGVFDWEDSTLTGSIAMLDCVVDCISWEFELAWLSEMHCERDVIFVFWDGKRSEEVIEINLKELTNFHSCNRVYDSEAERTLLNLNQI